MSALDTEVLLAGGYTLLMLAVGLGLDWLARVTHNRSSAYRTAGFSYHPDHDHWICPEGEHLWPHEYDHERRLVRYRAKAHVCNGCPVKERCTDSDRGREIVRALDPWPHSEAGRFHRGLALVPVGLAALILVVTAVRHPVAEDLAALAALAGLTALTARRLSGAFRATPANFPAPSPSQGLRLRRNSRTTWGWDR
ncbi:MAG: transposase [Actinomycetota bacterium]